MKITSVVVLLSLTLLLGCSGAGSEAQYIAKAQSYIEKGDNKAALIELKNVLQINPEQKTARLLLGRLYLNAANYAAAEKELATARKLGVTDQEVLPDLSIALVRLRKSQELEALNSEQLNNQGKAMVLASKGLSKLQQNLPEEASRLTSESIKLDRNSPYTHVAHANVLFSTEPDYGPARKELKNALEIDRDYSLALSLLGDIEARERNFKAAIEAYSRVIGQSESNFIEMNKRAMAYIYSGQLDIAQQDIDRLKKAFPLHPGVNYAQGLVYFESGKLQDAKTAFESALSGVEYYPLTLFHLANITYKQGDLAQAETYAEQFFSGHQTHLLGRKLLALIKYKKQKTDEVEPLLTPVLEQAPDDIVALNLLAHTRFKQNKTDSAIALLRKVAELDPKSTEANINLASGLINTGEAAQGFALLDEITTLNSDSDLPYIVKILSHLKLRQYKEALSTVENFKQHKPDSEMPYTLQGMVYLAQNDLAAAEKAYTRSLEIKQDNPAANMNLARIALSKNDYPKAISHYKAIMSYQTNHLEALLGLAGIQKAQAEEKLMLTTLEQAMNAHPKAFQPRVQLARYYLKKGQTNKVPGLIETLDSDTKNIPDVKELLTHLHISKKEYKFAENLATQLRDQLPKSAIPHFLLSQIHAGMGNADKSEAALQAAVKADPEYIPARIVLLRKLLRTADQATLEKEISEVKRLAPENEDVLQLEFSITRKSGKDDDALKLADALWKRYPNWTNVNLLAKQKLSMSDKAGFVNLHNTWLNEHPQHIPAILSLAGYYQSIGNEQLASEQYSKILKLQPENIIVLNNLAWSMRNSNTEKALEYSKKANELKERTPALMDTLAMIHMENSDYNSAKRVMKDVLFMEPENRTFQYHQALIAYKSGDAQEAKKLLEKMLGDKADFSGRTEAEALRASIK